MIKIDNFKCYNFLSLKINIHVSKLFLIKIDNFKYYDFHLSLLTNIQMSLKYLFGQFYEQHIKHIYLKQNIRQINDPIKRELDRVHGIQTNDGFLRDSRVAQQIGKLHEHLMSHQPGWKKCISFPADIMRSDMSVFIELKNNWNTMNSGSKRSVLNNLISIKNKHPKSLVCLGIINSKNIGSVKLIDMKHDIYCYSGSKLFELVYADPNMNQKITETIRDYFAKN